MPIASPASVATLASSTRCAPLAITSTGAPEALLNTSDLAIWPTVQPRTAAASADVRAGASYSTTRVATPAASSASCTRCAEADSVGYPARAVDWTPSSTSSSHSVPLPCIMAPTSMNSALDGMASVIV